VGAGEAAGLRPIKLNAVVVRSFNEEDVVRLAALTLERDWHVRFIETMPLGRGEVAAVARAGLVPSAESRARIEAVLGPLLPLPFHDAADESRNYRLPGGRGVVGFLSPVSEPYCGTCNRMRLTADGRFHLCLLRDDELDVRGALRAGAGLDAIARLLLRAVGSKPTGHRLDLGRSTEAREMYQIGGYRGMEIPGLEEASRLLGGAVLGPRELTAALGFDPLAVLPEDERPAVARIPFGAADLERL